MEQLFLAACEEGSTSIVSKYIRKGLNVNCSDRYGCTGLMKACLNGNYEIAKMLIDAGSSVNLTDFYGQNTLHYAVKGNNEKLCKLICHNKADSNVRNRITLMQSKEYVLKPVGTSLESRSFQSNKEYIKQTKEILKAENANFLLDRNEPRTKEDKIYDVIRRYECLQLSDPESDGDDLQHSGVYKKKKKKKKGKKGKKSKKGGKKSGKKKRH